MVRVSVIMSVHNGDNHLSECLESIELQSFPAVESVFVNDKSTDKTSEILANFKKENPSVTIIDNVENLGLTKSLNLALSYATGEYIARIDHDDVWFRDKLAKQVAFMEKNPSIGLLGAAYHNISVQGKILSNQKPSFIDSVNLKNTLYKLNPICHSSVIIRRTLLEKVGSYDINFRYAQDYELWTRILKNCEGAILPEILCARRVDCSSISFEKKREQRFYAMWAKLRWAKNNGFSASMIGPLLRDIAVISAPKLLFNLNEKHFRKN